MKILSSRSSNLTAILVKSLKFYKISVLKPMFSMKSVHKPHFHGNLYAHKPQVWKSGPHIPTRRKKKWVPPPPRDGIKYLWRLCKKSRKSYGTLMFYRNVQNNMGLQNMGTYNEQLFCYTEVQSAEYHLSFFMLIQVNISSFSILNLSSRRKLVAYLNSSLNFTFEKFKLLLYDAYFKSLNTFSIC